MGLCNKLMQISLHIFNVLYIHVSEPNTRPQASKCSLKFIQNSFKENRHESFIISYRSLG
jgi:hypothetical protein